MRRLGWILMLALLLTAGCGVTESGNPCPGGDCPATAGPDSESEQFYENYLYGVRIAYPESWTLVSEDAESVDFESGGAAPKSTVTVRFERHSPPPASLLAFLQARYPERTFLNFSTPTLLGYYYDDPADGPNGGDVHEYYFLDGEVLVIVGAEIIEATRPEVMALIDGIVFI